jgi:hypothetical protein
MKQKQLLFILVGMMVLMLGGQMSSPIQRARLQQEIAQMQRRGYTVKFLDNNLIELTEPMTGAKRLWSLDQPSEGEIRAWAARRGIPILEIDPRTIDTARFTNWFRYAGSVPVGMGGSVDEIIVGDIDNNNRSEVYGFNKLFPEPEVAIYEAASESLSNHRYTYRPFPGGPIGLTDIDRNLRTELAAIQLL